MRTAGLLTLDRTGLDQAAETVLGGGVIGYPTETVYGLGAIPSNAAVIRRIRQLKGRDKDKPLLILIPHQDYLMTLVKPLPEAIRLAGHFWPGPLTLVFQAVSGLPEGLTGPDGSLGMRVSPDPVCRILLEKLGAALISTSANPAGSPPALTAAEVIRYFGHRLDAVLDDGPRNLTAPSTVVDVRTVPFTILREGAVPAGSLKQKDGELFE